MDINKLHKALHVLMPLRGWSCDGEKVTIHELGVANGYTIPTRKEIAAAIEELEGLKYRELRVRDLPSIPDQLDMQYWDLINGTTKWVDMITANKEKHSKPD